MRYLLALCLALLSTFSFGQDLLAIPDTERSGPSTDVPDSATLAGGNRQPLVSSRQATSRLLDAPSATAQSSHTNRSSCTEGSGKPCPEWVHKLVGQSPPINSHEEWNGKPDCFFTIGDGRRSLHPDKKSWIVLAVAHAGMWASAVAAVRNSPTSNQPAHSAYPAAAALTGMDLLIFKTLSPAIPLGPSVYAIVKYSKAASK